MNAFEQESSFVRFGTWSVVVHIFFFVFVSLVHFSLDVEKPPPTVKVTFVESPAPPPPEPEPQAPPMLQTQRLQPQPVQRKQVQPKPPDIAQPVEVPEVVAQPPPPQQPPPQPLKRRMLTDSRATDTLQARNLTKVASRRTPLPTSKTKVDEGLPEMFVPGFSTVAALEGAATRRVVRTSLPATAPGRAKRTLQATRGEAQATTSVGVLHSVHPIYPRIAKKSGWEGTVLVRVTVETNGRASKVVVTRSSGRKVLDNAAVKAVKRWSFRPARDGNIPIRTQVVIPIKFSLDKA